MFNSYHDVRHTFGFLLTKGVGARKFPESSREKRPLFSREWL